jgi:hypothetical protein
LDDLLKRMTNGSGLQAEFHLEGDEPTMPAEWERAIASRPGVSDEYDQTGESEKNFRRTFDDWRETEIHFRLVDRRFGFDLHAEHEWLGLLGHEGTR